MKIRKRHPLGTDLWGPFNLWVIKKREASKDHWAVMDKNVRRKIAVNTDDEAERKGFLRSDHSVNTAKGSGQRTHGQTS